MRMTPGISEDGGSQNNRSSAWGQIEGYFHFKGECISKIINWRELEQGKQDSAEVIEDDVRHYFCWLQDTISAPTRAHGLLSAVNYMRHVFGYEEFQPICESRRLAGLADVLYAAKAPLKQAKVLTVEEVAWLHLRLEDSATHKTDRAIVAYILIALYGRCRHSDLAHVTRVLQDFDNTSGFVEIQTRSHKTAKSAANKAVLLPIVVPAIGITGQLWVQHAIDAFNEVGLQLGGSFVPLSVEGRIGGQLQEGPQRRSQSFSGFALKRW